MALLGYLGNASTQRELMPASERRRFRRKKGFWRATVSLPGRAPVDCILRDVSEAGALVELAVPPGIATKLHLYVEVHAVDIECVVRHVSGNFVGVEFLRYSDHQRTRLTFGRRRHEYFAPHNLRGN